MARTAATVVAGMAAALALAPAGLAQSASDPPAVFDRWGNPLPPPLDGAFGTFLIQVIFWLALASLVRFIVGPVLKRLATSTKTTVDDTVIDILGTPVFLAVFFLGVRSSLGAFDLTGWPDRLLDAAGGLLLIVVVGYVLYRSWNELALVYAKRLAQRKNEHVDNRLFLVMEKLGGVLILVMATVLLLQAMGFSLGWLLAGGAFVSLVIGLAAQDTLSNFFSGIHLLVDQPFQEGDEIELTSGEICTVRKIGLRSSHLYHVRHHEIIVVPNNLLATTMVINLMRPDRRHRIWLDIGVTYDSDPDQVRRLVAEAALGHPLVLREAGNEPQVRLVDLGPPALRYTLVFWVADHTQRHSVASDLRIAVLRRFKEAGIHLPTVVLPQLPEESTR